MKKIFQLAPLLFLFQFIYLFEIKAQVQLDLKKSAPIYFGASLQSKTV